MSSRLPAHLKDEPFLRLSALFFEDADEHALPHAAQLLYLRMATRTRQLRSDGWISEAHIEGLRVPSWRKHLKALEDVSWITRDATNGHGAGRARWYVSAYLKWNLSEDDYGRRSHEGRVGGCTSKHEQPCQRAPCIDSRAWLDSHPAPSRGG